MEIDQRLNLKEENKLDSLSILLSTVMFTLLIVLVSAQVLMRIFNLPITAVWTEPIARYMFIVGTYVGAAVASRNNEHVRLTLIRERLLSGRERAQFVLDVVSVLAVLAFVAVALWALAQAAIQGWNTKALGGIATLTAGHIYMGIFAGFSLMAVFEIQNLIAAVEGVFGSDVTTERPTEAKQ